MAGWWWWSNDLFVNHILNGMSQIDAFVCLMARFLMIFVELMWLGTFRQWAWRRLRFKWAKMPFKFELFKQSAHRHVEFIELPSRPRIDSWWCLGNYNIDCLLIGGVGWSFLKNEVLFILQHAIIDCIFHLSTSYDQRFEVQEVLGKKMLVESG